MQPSHQLNDIEWINAHLGTEAALDQEKIDSILHFALIWNLFEGRCCDQSASVSNFEKVTERLSNMGQLQINDFDEAFRYFKGRYIQNGNTNQVFDSLFFRRNDRKEFVENVLMEDDPKVEDVVLALLIIIYRLRNNLFHGVKELYTLGKQTDNFTNANLVLRRILELDKP